jgi:hypothetical protein
MRRGNVGEEDRGDREEGGEGEVGEEKIYTRRFEHCQLCL